MYKAKQDGRNGYRFFTAKMQSHAKRMLTLEGAMRQALEVGQFYLHYQPQLSADGRKVVGVEALLRWKHPELGQISPAEFIPLAERNGQIIPIGTWVLREAVQQLRTWLDAGLPPMVIAVNLSAVQFRQPNLPALVTKILEDAQLAPEYLEIELTEGVTLADPQGAIDVMNDLHSRGVRMSIDDFGTGYSSLSYLKKFKVYKLKIDQSFVRDIATDADDRAIVTAIVQMAHNVGFVAIAEGVETPAQLAFLNQQGCDEVQGYLFSKPLPADQIEDFVRNVVAKNGIQADIV
jgi:EAL domain-containing protein (putative c-di-GMP-specific phosphodiesterase class I)